ncbi:MAG: MFS transporter [Alphaproteobacteria bacterium]|nr:MFS transporter [Alphaproteobacteria bacterium]
MAEKLEPKTDRPGSRLVLFMACLGTLVVAFNTTAVVTAIPEIKRDLVMGAEALQWVVSAYMLACASLVAVVGRCADIFGKLRIFTLGLATFAIGSAAAVLATETVLMLFGRILQGIGAASIFATPVAILSVTTPEAKRATVVGLWGGMVALGFGIGPITGGLLTAYIGWRAIFVFDIILLSFALGLAWRVGKAAIIPKETHRDAKLDNLGVVFLVVTLATLAYGLTNAHVAGWWSFDTLSTLSVAIVAAAAFAIAERHAADPLINFRYFTKPRFVAATAGMSIVGFVMTAFLYFYNLFVQAPGTMHLSPINAGLSLLPLTAMMFALSILAPRLLAPYSFRWPTVIGMAFLVVGLWLLHYTTDQSAYGDFWWVLLLVGAGFGLTMPLLPRVGLRVLPDGDAGQGSGTINTCLYFGCTMGIVAGGLVTAHVEHAAVAAVVATVHSGPADQLGLIHELAHGSAADVKQALAQFTAADAETIKATLIGVLDDTFDDVMVMASLVALLGSALCVWLMRGPIANMGKASQ